MKQDECMRQDECMKSEDVHEAEWDGVYETGKPVRKVDE